MINSFNVFVLCTVKVCFSKLRSVIFNEVTSLGLKIVLKEISNNNCLLLLVFRLKVLITCVRAKAESDAIKLKAEALKANKDLVDLKIAEKWNGTVPQTVLISGDKSGTQIFPLLNIGNSSAK